MNIRTRILVDVLGITVSILGTVVLIVWALALVFPGDEYLEFRMFAAAVGGYWTSKLTVWLLRRHQRRRS